MKKCVLSVFFDKCRFHDFGIKICVKVIRWEVYVLLYNYALAVRRTWGWLDWSSNFVVLVMENSGLWLTARLEADVMLQFKSGSKS